MSPALRGKPPEAPCPVCGETKPVYGGRFCRHADSYSGECPASGKTVAEAKSLRKEGGDDPDPHKPSDGPSVGLAVAPGGPAEPGEPERAGPVLPKVWNNPEHTWDKGEGMVTHDVAEPPQDGVTTAETSIAPTPASELPQTVTSGVALPLGATRTRRKARGDRTQYLVTNDLPLVFASEETATKEAESRMKASDAPDERVFIFAIRPVARYERGVTVTRLGRGRLPASPTCFPVIKLD